jgi:hypothetical protein
VPTGDDLASRACLPRRWRLLRLLNGSGDFSGWGSRHCPGDLGFLLGQAFDLRGRRRLISLNTIETLDDTAQAVARGLARSIESCAVRRQLI